jgi:hypothetical protein
MHDADAQRLAETMSALAVTLAAEHNHQGTPQGDRRGGGDNGTRRPLGRNLTDRGTRDQSHNIH